MRLLAALLVLALLLAPAYAASIENVARIKQKGYIEYSYSLTYDTYNFTGKYIFAYKSYKSVSDGYNITIEEDFFLEGYGRDNETNTYTRKYTEKARVDIENVPFFDQQRLDEAVKELKDYYSGISFHEESLKYKIGDKSFEALKLYGENDTMKIEIILGKYLGVVLYGYELDKKSGSVTIAKAEDTNIKEEKSTAAGSALRIALIVIVIAVVAVLAYLMMKKKA